MKEKKPVSIRVKFAKTFFILGIIGVFLAILPFVSILAVVFYVFLLVVVAMATLFIILLNDKFKEHIEKASQITTRLSEYIKYTPYALIASSGLFLLSTVLLLFAKNKRQNIVLLTFSIIAFLATLVVYILIINNKIGVGV